MTCKKVKMRKHAYAIPWDHIVQCIDCTISEVSKQPKQSFIIQLHLTLYCISCPPHLQPSQETHSLFVTIICVWQNPSLGGQTVIITKEDEALKALPLHSLRPFDVGVLFTSILTYRTLKDTKQHLAQDLSWEDRTNLNFVQIIHLLICILTPLILCAIGYFKSNQKEQPWGDSPS